MLPGASDGMNVGELDRIEWSGADGVERSCPMWRGAPANQRLQTCKRRDCPRCGRPWARSWESVLRENLRHYGGPVGLVTITAPGVDVLPWACTREHEHAGHKGCRVEGDAADRWADAARGRWQKLRDVARKATIAHTPGGLKPTLLTRTWEPQKRGVPHLHVVLGLGTKLERIAARRFVDELARQAPAYGFGFVDRHLEEISAREAANYLAGYLLGRSGHKEGVRENIADPRMPRSLLWLTPALTSPGERFETQRSRLGIAGGATFVTMRRLRLVRWYFAALRGVAGVYPRLRGDLLVQVATVASRLEPRRTRAPGEDDEARFNRHLRNLLAMRRVPREGEEFAPYRLRAAAA